jgi:hypothetical protein
MSHSKMRVTVPGTIDPWGANEPCTVTVRWSTVDPAALYWRFVSNNNPANDPEWVFARSILMDIYAGGAAQSGEGDVMVGLEGDWLYLNLDSPEGQATVCVPAGKIWQLLKQADHVCPSGSDVESEVMDDELTVFLAESLPN